MLRATITSVNENDKNLINFIATTVETLRDQFESMRQQMVTKEDLAAVREQMATKRDLAEVKDQVDRIEARVDSIESKMAMKDDLAEMATKEDVVEMATKEDLAEMATKDDLAEMATKEDLAQMATKDDLAQMATKTNLSRLETTMHGEFEQVHLRLDSIDRSLSNRIGHIESEVSRLRSVLYWLVKDKPEMLRLLGRPTPEEDSLPS